MTATQEKTETETEHIVPLPAGHLACNACGTATPGRMPSGRSEDGRGLYRMHDIPEALCDACVVIRAEARAIARNRPRLAARYGSILDQRIECLRHVYNVLGIADADPSEAGRGRADLDVALVVYSQVLNSVWWARADRAAAVVDYNRAIGQCASAPYAFLTDPERRALRVARREELARMVADYVDDAEVACPSAGGCLLCGTTQPVRVSARKMMQHGGYEAAQRSVWRRIVTDARALGNPRGCPRGTTVEGHLCLACTRALEQSNHVFGDVTRQRAVYNHVLDTMGQDYADRLDELLDDYGAPTCEGAPWETRNCGTGPWSHLSGLFEVIQKAVFVRPETV